MILTVFVLRVVSSVVYEIGFIYYITDSFNHVSQREWNDPCPRQQALLMASLVVIQSVTRVHRRY